MVEILFGVIAGIVTSLGMGGGAILILLLGLFSTLEQHLIQGTNLVFFIPTSIVAIIMNIRNKTINFRQAIPIVIFGMIGAFIGSKISFIIESHKLKKIFGVFLIIIGIFEIFTFISQYNKNKMMDNKF